MYSSLVILFSIACPCLVSGNGVNITGKFGTMYPGNVSHQGIDMYSYKYNQSETKAVRLSVWSDAPEDYPVSFVVLEQKSVFSMLVPHIMDSGDTKLSYSNVSRTLCPSQFKDGAFSVRVSTFSPKNLSYTILAEMEDSFSLQIDQPLQVTAGPTEPLLLEYVFPEDIETVMLKVSSNSDHCAYLSVQTKKTCPVHDEFDSVPFTGTFQSMTTRAAVTVVEKDHPDGFYVVVVVHPDDKVCNSRSEPLTGSTDYFYASQQDARSKNFTISVVKTNSEYLKPVLITIGVGAAFYFFIAIIIFGYWLHNFCRGRATRLEVDVTAQVTEGRNLIDIPVSSLGVSQNNTRRTSGYGALDSCDNSQSTPEKNHPLSLASGVPHNQQEPDVRSEDGFDGYDTLSDIEHEQDVYLAKPQLFLSDTTRLDDDVRERKFTMYPWNLVTVAVFYALPVVQLVITYQIVLNKTGNQDTCYYNFLCARPAGVFSAFNNVYSNIGYILMGILLWLLIWRREVLYNQSSQEAKDTGIPKHYSLFYALAIALVVEGVMSGCYHVCPNNTNFQFDTSFMYIIACLCMIKLYQQRHPDIDPEPHRAFVVFAIIIFLGMIGVIFHNIYSYVTFFIIHITTCLFMSLHVYYKSTIPFDTGIFARVRLEFKNLAATKDFKPLYVGRFCMLLFGNAINWALSLFGLLTMPLDFASFLLSIFIINLLLYLGFYIVMKLFHRERLTPLVCFFIFMTLLLWIPALYFFEQGVTAWQETPALSRVHNKPCMVLDFYDSHDIWHFLSACGLFFSFMTILVLDDDLDGKPRDQIPVF